MPRRSRAPARSRGRNRGRFLKRKYDWIVNNQSWISNEEGEYAFAIAPGDSIQGLQLTWPVIRAEISGSVGLGSFSHSLPWRPKHVARVQGQVIVWQPISSDGLILCPGILRMRIAKVEYDFVDGTLVSLGIDDLWTRWASDQHIIWQRDVLFTGNAYYAAGEDTSARGISLVNINARINRTLEPNETLVLLLQAYPGLIPGWEGGSFSGVTETADFYYAPYVRTLCEV